jgi:predicted nucleotidyltransferase
MVDIDEIKPEIVKRLMPLNPDKIILFGSYAYGNPTEDSDIDLFLLKKGLSIDDSRYYQREVRLKVLDLVAKYKVGFDILSASPEYIDKREDYFYKVDILQNGEVIYE